MQDWQKTAHDKLDCLKASHSLRYVADCSVLGGVGETSRKVCSSDEVITMSSEAFKSCKKPWRIEQDVRVVVQAR